MDGLNKKNMETRHSLINELLLPEIDQNTLAIATAISIARARGIPYYLGIWFDGEHLRAAEEKETTVRHGSVGNELPESEISNVPSLILYAYTMLKEKSKKESRLRVKLLKRSNKSYLCWGEYLIKIVYE